MEVVGLTTAAEAMTIAVVPGCHRDGNKPQHNHGNRANLVLSSVECHQHIQPAGVLVAPSNNSVPGH